MSYTKSTCISGDKDGERKTFFMSGHWKLDAAIRRARRSGIVGEIEIEHSIYDGSGHGRGGHDGKWSVDGSDQIRLTEAWREGARILMPDGKICEDGWLDEDYFDPEDQL